MSDITTDCESFIWLLSLSQRKQTIGGKVSPQVHSLMVNVSSGRMTACSLVKDGLSSVSLLSIPAAGEGSFAISDIDSFLGALKYHGGLLKFIVKPDRITIKSNNKQTTLTSSDKALAFPHTASSIGEWERKSILIASKINIDSEGKKASYELSNGEIRKPFASWIGLDTTTLYEAFRCDSMNSQKLNLYTIHSDEQGLHVEVGKELKGKTTTTITSSPIHHEMFSATYQGGLEYLFANLNSEASLHFFDFRAEQQGIRMLITLGNADFIFQASVLG